MGPLSRRRRSALGVVLAALVAGALWAGARAAEWRSDVSLAALSAPAPATVAAFRDSDTDVELLAFFDERDPIWARLEPWLAALAGQRVRVRRVTPGREPDLEREHEVVGAGVVVVTTRGASEQVVVGTRPAVARRSFARLDGEVVAALGRALAPPRLALFVAGHGEREPQARLRALLAGAGLEVRSWDLARAIPAAERPLVVWLDPSGPGRETESRALSRFVREGGRLLAVFERAPDASLLTSLGVRAQPGVLRGPEGDERLRAQASGAHPLTAELPAPLTVDGARGFARLGEARAVAPLWIPRAYPDADGDGARGVGEPLREQAVMTTRAFVPRAGLEREGRAVVLGDADLLGDEGLRRPGEAALARRVLEWLGEDDEARRPVAPLPPPAEIDLLGPEHRSRTFAVLFGLPAALLLIGGAQRIRSRR